MADEERKHADAVFEAGNGKKYTRLQLADLIAKGRFMPMGLTEKSFKIFTDTILETDSFTLLYPEEGLLERKIKD